MIESKTAAVILLTLFPGMARSAPAQEPASQEPGPAAQRTAADQPAFKQEELDQMLAPVALYPDALLTQVLMAATYPLEIVQAERWAKAHKDLQGDAKAKALEQEPWDPSVKSLIDFPPVLEMLSEKLDWTQKLGDAFIGQQKEVLETVQKLRAKAKENGQLETTDDLKVDVEQQGSTQVITIESANPEVIYVPTYDPVVVYGSWWYPAYPPYPYYPPGYAAGGAFVIGVAWGYAWGHCDWHGGDVDIDIDQNVDINHNIDRDKYGDRGNLKDGKGTWKHDASHRGSVPYRDSATAKQQGGVSSADAARSREADRGRADSGRTELNQGAADSYRGSSGASSRESSRGSSAATRPSSSSSRNSALSGVRSSGSSARTSSSRGRSSRGGGRR